MTHYPLLYGLAIWFLFNALVAVWLTPPIRNTVNEGEGHPTEGNSQ
ncbi:MAG: hypothetical protein ACREHV_11610 [Rhizomicrobium sp.]